MLWSPNEVLAYLKEDLNLPHNEANKAKTTSKTLPFGGFSPLFCDKQDFVLIAENSEIFGPNPLFTIPYQSEESDLNVLSTRILSADYQGLSCKKVVSLEHAQLLMPGVSKNINIAVNYFLLFDSEARGFIRPTCIAYITADKYKLVSCADSILNALSEASTILQHCNMLTTIDSLKRMLEEVTSQPKEENSNNAALQDKVTEDVSKDIKDIIEVIEAYKGSDTIDSQISTLLESLKKPGVFPEIGKFFSTASYKSDTQPLQWKSKNHHCLQKCMKSLYSICGNGFILGLYHLYILHKHFKRKYENIYLEKHFGQKKTSGERLHYGACVKKSNLDVCNFTLKDCILKAKRISKLPSMDSEQYFSFLDESFNQVLLDFLNWEQKTSSNIDPSQSYLQSSDCSDVSVEKSFSSSSSGYMSSENVESIDSTITCGHIVPLLSMWDIFENLEKDNPGVEAAFLEIIKLFDDTKRILFSVFTRTPVVIISTPEDSVTAQNFIIALSVFIPRRVDEVLLVDINRTEPLKAEEIQYIAALNVCLPQTQAIEEIIPQHLWPSLCILNLRNCSLTAPEYMGVLLSNIDERFRMLPLDGPAFPIFVGILCEVQQSLEWWLMVTQPSLDASAASSFILSKGFSRMDVQILLKLSKLCRR